MSSIIDVLADRLDLGAPDPEDSFADVGVHDGPEEMVVVPEPYRGPLAGSSEEVDEIARLLFRCLMYVYYGGLERAVPDALTSDKALAVELFLPASDLPDTTRDVLEAFAAFFAERAITLRVIQLPVEALGQSG